MSKKFVDAFIKKYGHLTYPEILEALRKDGFGEVVDNMLQDPQFNAFMAESGALSPDESEMDAEYGIIPTATSTIPTQPVDYDATFQFDAQACLTQCQGNCCKDRNYLMIHLADIYRLLQSPVAAFFNIQSTIDLFEHQPPFIELFLSEEYGLFLPYLRFLPVGTDLGIRPEDAEHNICPFLRPIQEVYAYHHLTLPANTHQNAMGCMLMAAKPSICRLSPLGESRGMLTGKVSFEYGLPTTVCPACTTEVEVPVAEYLMSVTDAEESEYQARFHAGLICFDLNRTDPGYNRNRFNTILKDMYHIDGLLARYRLGPQARPALDDLLDIILAAADGEFDIYDQFLADLKRRAKLQRKRQKDKRR